MSNTVLLDNVTHKNLKIITRKSAAFGDNLPSVLTFPQEFRNIQTHYPICFQQDSQNGRYYAAALMGFEDNENVFLDQDHWDASYIPLMIERQPFFIGGKKTADGQETQVIYVDMDSPRISETEGEFVFMAQGGNSAYLDRISNILGAIHQGQEDSLNFFNALLEYELMEPFTLEVKLVDGSNNKLVGFQTINEEKLRALPAGVLETFSRNGILQQAYWVLASQSNFAALIQRKNNRIESNTLGK
ncbi:hypothetical protein TDB9533_00586 [Thalassocella blandensis]|nr:hypothetical protein TDB9533_00586 [Thalassocella blandensis]